MVSDSFASRRSSAKLAAWLVLIALLVVGAAIDLQLTLTMAPALLMLALFAAGVHPGERLLQRFVEGRGQLARAASSVRPRLAMVIRPVGCDLASALAMRPPPVAAAAA